MSQDGPGHAELPNWRDEFPPEGPTPDDPIDLRQRFIRLRYSEVALECDGLITVDEGGDDENSKGAVQARQVAIRAVEAKIRVIQELARVLGVTSKEALAGLSSRDKNLNATQAVLRIHQSMHNKRSAAGGDAG